MDAAVQAVADSAPRRNVHYLQRQVVDLAGIRFAGCTLWNAIPSEEVAATLHGSVNDFAKISLRDAAGAPRAFGPGDVMALHQRDVEFITAVISDNASPGAAEQPPLVVLTHYAPTFRMTAIPGEFAARPKAMRWMHGDDLERLITRPVCVWAFGHTHRTVEYVLGDTLVVSNQVRCGRHDWALPLTSRSRPSHPRPGTASTATQSGVPLDGPYQRQILLLIQIE